MVIKNKRSVFKYVYIEIRKYIKVRVTNRKKYGKLPESSPRPEKSTLVQEIRFYGIFCYRKRAVAESTIRTLNCSSTILAEISMIS